MLATVWGHVRDCAGNCAARCCCARARSHGLERGCRAWWHPGLVVTHGAAQPFLRWHHESQRSHHDDHVHNVVIESRMVHRGCRVEVRIGM